MRTFHKTKFAIPGMTLNNTFALLMKANGIPPCQPEFKFHPSRKWRFDFYWPESRVAVEIEGGMFIPRGGHTTGVAYGKNCEKYNEAALMGITILRFTNKMLEENSGYVMDTIRRAIALKTKPQ